MVDESQIDEIAEKYHRIFKELKCKWEDDHIPSKDEIKDTIKLLLKGLDQFDFLETGRILIIKDTEGDIDFYFNVDSLVS